MHGLFLLSLFEGHPYCFRGMYYRKEKRQCTLECTMDYISYKIEFWSMLHYSTYLIKAKKKLELPHHSGLESHTFSDEV